MTDDEWRELEDVVAAHDPDRLVATFFAPASKRRPLIALYAFGCELGHIAEAVREPMLGHVRLAWWRERISAIYEGAAQQAPTAKALAELVRSHKLDRALLDRLIDARAHDFDEAPFADEPGFEDYADATEGNLMRLAVQILGLAPLQESTVRNAAIATALGAELRRAQREARRRRFRLPLTWLTAGGMDLEGVFADPAALALIAPHAGERIAQALAAANRTRFRASAMPALSCATMARLTDPARHTPWRRSARIAVATLAWRL